MALRSAPHPYSRSGVSPALTVIEGRRGKPEMLVVRATEIADLVDEIGSLRREGIDFATEVRAHACRVHLAAVSDRPDLALHEAAAIVSAADRHLRQRGVA